MAHMIEKYDNMFSVREKPWHGLGVIVQDAPTSEDAIKIAGLDWTVRQSNVYTDTGAEMPGYFINYREVTDENGNVTQLPLGIVSDRYQIVQNKEAFGFTDALLGEGVRYETAGSLNNGKRIWLLARMPENVNVAGDEVEPYLCFTSGHDGKNAIQICMTPIRVVCNNTLNLALNRASRTWSTHHKGTVLSKLEEAKYQLGMASTYMKHLEEEADRLANLRFTEEQFRDLVDALFPEKDGATERQQKNVQTMKDGIIACYFAPDILQFQNTAWGAMNAFTDYAGHAAPIRKSKNFTENRFGNIISGHTLVDKAYSNILELTAVR